MPYVAPATVVTATTITSAWGNSVKAATDYLANPPACRVYHSATQSLPDVTDTIVAFNSERFDTNTMHDTATNNSRITINTAGVYVVSFTGEVESAADYVYVYSYFRLNGATLIAISPISRVGAFGIYTSLSTVYKFAAGDYVQVLIRQDNTANVARNLAAVGNYSPEFAATWIGLG